MFRTSHHNYQNTKTHNLPFYQHIMFEVALLSNKTIDEVIQKWPKFDIFSIADCSTVKD